MTNILFVIASILVLSAGLSRFLDIWITPKGKDDIKVKIELLWIKIDDSKAVSFAIAPLKLLETLYNNLFGNRIFSKKAYIRSFILCNVFLICFLSVSGLFTGASFSLTLPPWQIWKNYSNLPDTAISTTDLSGNPLSDEQINETKKTLAFFGSKKWIIFHSILFVFLTLILNALFDATSLSITRMMLREAVSSSSTITILCILFTNFIIALLLSTLSMIFAFFIYLPHTVFLLQIFFSAFQDYPLLTLTGTFGAMLFIWKVSGIFFKIIAFTTVLPILFLCFSLLLYLLIYPFKNILRNFFCKLLLQITTHEKGIFTFLFIFFASIGSIIGVIYQSLK